MLTRILIFTLLASVCLAGDSDPKLRALLREARREEQRHKKLAAQPTPAEWHQGSIWRFVTTAPAGKPQPPPLTVRVTAEPAKSCSSWSSWKNDWRKLVLAEGTAPLPPIYQIDGRALVISVAGEICDVYDDIEGVLTNGEFSGRRSTSGLGARTEFIGTVHGSLLQP
jgi:hypothetical protein